MNLNDQAKNMLVKLSILDHLQWHYEDIDDQIKLLKSLADDLQSAWDREIEEANAN